jgi:hypothetical protein
MTLLDEIEECSNLDDVERLLLRHTDMNKSTARFVVDQTLMLVKAEDRELAQLIRLYC